MRTAAAAAAAASRIYEKEKEEDTLQGPKCPPEYALLGQEAQVGIPQGGCTGGTDKAPRKQKVPGNQPHHTSEPGTVEGTRAKV